MKIIFFLVFSVNSGTIIIKTNLKFFDNLKNYKYPKMLGQILEKIMTCGKKLSPE